MQIVHRIIFFLAACAVFSTSGVAIAADTVAANPQNSATQPAQKEAEKAPEKIFNAETFSLDNGLQIVVIPNHRAPVITHMVWYKVGGADELPGKSGIAHFLEHLMFKGSTGLQPGEFSKRVRAKGGIDNAFTSHDYTAYYQSISVDYLEAVMTMEAGRMRGLHPPEREVAAENKVILEERRQRTENNPGALLSEQMNALLYINHPYARPVIGWAHEASALNWADAKLFYDQWYAPNNAILIVSGDVTGNQVYDLAKKIYGPIPKSEALPTRVRTQSPPLKGPPDVTLKDSNVREPVVQTAYRAPSARQDKGESLALEVLNEIMGGGASSRLYKSLVIHQKIATGTGFSYAAENWDSAEVWVYATPAPGHDPRVVKAALDAELRLLVEKGVSDDELKDAQRRLKTEAIYARDSLTGPAMAFGHVLSTGGTIEDVEYWAHNIEQVTAQKIQDTAKKYLDPDTAYDHAPVTGYLVPENMAQEEISEPAAGPIPGFGPAPPPVEGGVQQ